MKSTLFINWLEVQTCTDKNISHYGEQTGMRNIGLKELKKLLREHFVGAATIAKMGGYKAAAQAILESLPTNKRTRSGDLAELIATEYVESETPFKIYIKKLRWKSDRQMPMHGNDIIGVKVSGTSVLVLKGECKSRSNFSGSVAKEAAATLDDCHGRPNPSTIAFIMKRLYEEGKDKEADIFKRLLCKGAIAPEDITHLTFVLSGNDPCSHLTSAPKPKKPGIKRKAAAVVVSDHASFVSAVYGTSGSRS